MKPAYRISDTNPVADQLDDLSRPLIDSLFNAMDAVTNEPMIDHGGFLGFRRAAPGEPSSPLGCRPATNEECAFLQLDWCLPTEPLDLRKPLPRQLSKLLGKLAGMLLEAADAVEAIEDARDLKLIKRLTTDPQPQRREAS